MTDTPEANARIYCATNAVMDRLSQATKYQLETELQYAQVRGLPEIEQWRVRATPRTISFGRLWERP